MVYAKPPFGGPQHVLCYLACYTNRVAISNHRIVNVAEGKVNFRWKDSGSKTNRTFHRIVFPCNMALFCSATFTLESDAVRSSQVTRTS